MKLKREGRADVTLAKKRWLFDFAYPTIGERPVAEITAPEVYPLPDFCSGATGNPAASVKGLLFRRLQHTTTQHA